MVEQIQKKEYKNWMDYPYKDYPLFEYVNKVADHFWWVKRPKEGNHYDCEIAPSNVPTMFAERYLGKLINTDRLPMYLALTRKPFKHLKFDQLDIIPIKKIELNIPHNNPTISENLKAYNLDISKFWYLCLCIKDYVEGQTKKGCLLFYPTRRTEIKSLINELERLKAIERSNYIFTPDDTLFELNLKTKRKGFKGNGKNVWNSTRGTTLTIIKNALVEYLKNNEDNKLLLDIREIDVNSKVKVLKMDKGETIKVALFCRYLGWFLNQCEIDKLYVQTSLHNISSRNLLITRMVYLTGLSDNKEFLNGINDYALTYSSKSKDVEVNTNNKYYSIIPDEVIKAMMNPEIKNGTIGIF